MVGGAVGKIGAVGTVGEGAGVTSDKGGGVIRAEAQQPDKRPNNTEKKQTQQHDGTLALYLGIKLL